MWACTLHTVCSASRLPVLAWQGGGADAACCAPCCSLSARLCLPPHPLQHSNCAPHVSTLWGRWLDALDRATEAVLSKAVPVDK